MNISEGNFFLYEIIQGHTSALISDAILLDYCLAATSNKARKKKNIIDIDEKVQPLLPCHQHSPCGTTNRSYFQSNTVKAVFITDKNA